MRPMNMQDATSKTQVLLALTGGCSTLSRAASFRCGSWHQQHGRHARNL